MIFILQNHRVTKTKHGESKTDLKEIKVNPANICFFIFIFTTQNQAEMLL